MVTIRKSVSQSDREGIEQALSRSLNFMKSKYPSVDFDKVDFIFSGTGSRGRYFRNEEANAEYKAPCVFVPTQREDEIMYWKPSLGMVRDTVKDVGRFDVMASCVVHELTHHVQYETGLNKGEVLTTENELLYYKEFRPDVYELFMNL